MRWSLIYDTWWKRALFRAGYRLTGALSLMGARWDRKR